MRGSIPPAQIVPHSFGCIAMHALATRPSEPPIDGVLDAIVTAADEAHVVVAATGAIIIWNTAAEHLLGYEKCEIVGRHIRCLLPEAWRDQWDRRLVQIRDGEVFRGASVRIHKNGTPVDVFVTARAIRDRHGVFSGYLLIFEDQKKKAERERDNELLASIVRGSPEAILSIGIDFQVRSWNAAAARLFGYTATEVLGKPLQAVLVAADGHANEAIWDDIRSDKSHQSESMFVDKDGRRFPMMAVSHAVINAAGVVTGWTLFCSDLTKKKEAERNLRASEDFSRAILENSHDWIVVVTLDGKVTYNNGPKGQGLTAAQMGSDWISLWDPAHHGALSQAIDTARSTGTARAKAMRRANDGRASWYDITMAQLEHHSSQRSGVIISARDITVQVQWDAHNRVIMRELSHRAKNLLAVVSAMARSTAGRSGSLGQFEDDFAARLRGLAKCHDLLVHEAWLGVPLHDLVRQQISHFLSNHEQLALAGPDVILCPAAAQCLGMAFHELATNATKYGSLSDPTGHVSIECWQNGDDYLISWKEHGGPPVTAPALRGFGSEVIEDMVSATLNCDARIEFEPSGIAWSCRISRAFVASGHSTRTAPKLVHRAS